MFLEQRHELYSLLSMPNFTKTEKLNFQFYRQSTIMAKICWEKLLLETVLVEEQLLTQWFWETSSSIMSTKHTPILIAAIGYITYRCSLIPPSWFPAVLFFLPPDPLEQCWATQINTYMNLIFSKPSIGLGGGGGGGGEGESLLFVYYCPNECYWKSQICSGNWKCLNTFVQDCR